MIDVNTVVGEAVTAYDGTRLYYSYIKSNVLDLAAEVQNLKVQEVPMLSILLEEDLVQE